VKCFWARRVRRINGRWRVLELAADNREAAPGKCARCLPTSMLTQGRTARNQMRGGLSRRKERRGLAATILMICRRRKTMHGGYCDNVRTPLPERSSTVYHALPHRYPLSTCSSNIREFEPGLARRLTLEASVLDGRAISGWRVRPLANFPERYPGTIQKKAGEMTSKTFQRRGKSASFFRVTLLVPSTCPRGDGGPRL
jgi:hypothetical protein